MRYLLLTLLIAFLFIGGCSDGKDKKTENHIWKEKADTIKKAEAVKQLMQESAEKQKQAINKQSR